MSQTAEPLTAADEDAPTPRFLDDRLSHWASATPDAEAVTYLDRTFTWRQWEERIARLAGALRAAGVGRGDAVAFFDKNHVAGVELALASARLGAAAAMVNFRLAPDEVAYTIADSGAKVVVVGEELRSVLDGVRDQLPAVETVLGLTPNGADGDEYEAFVASGEPIARGAEVEPGDVVLLMYSSGTTGRPKGVMITQSGMLAHTLASLASQTHDPGDKALVAMPLFHVGGSSSVHQSIHTGIPTIMTREADGPSLAGAIMAGANRTFLVPAVFAQILAGPPEGIALFGRVKFYAYGASPMPLPVLRAAMAAWPDTEFMQVYGLTEVCGVATSLLPEDHTDAEHPERLTSAGRPIPGVEVRIVDTVTLEDLPVGESGEIWLRTPQLMRGYHHRDDATREVIDEDGWFRTGDIGRVDEGGYVFVEDRLKDMIITGGENVYSPEVERVLAEHPAVMEVAIIGVPDDRWGETVKAVVSLHPRASATEEELIGFCRERLARFKCPSSVDVLEALPRNPTGKIMKRELRKPYWDSRDRQV